MNRQTGPTRNLVGRRFGRLKVLALHGRIDGRYHWLCRCECGTETTPYGGSLVAGLTTSCGCLKRERTAETHTTHGHTKGRLTTRAYRAWFAMLGRVKRDRHYTERGIGVAPRWESFENFLADMGEPPPGTTLDRIDNDGDYGPGACRWATRAQQMRNTRSTRMVTFRGETLCLKDWADRLGINSSTLDTRLAQWSLERALTEPAHRAPSPSSSCRPASSPATPRRARSSR